MGKRSTFDWEVLLDPEHTFRGTFRWLDLICSAQDGIWPEGIVFKHRQTGQTVIYRDGQLLTGSSQAGQATA